MSKIFIIGLPRTGTTSISVALLDLGYKVAHCALTERSINTADVIADTPSYCDYQIFDKQFPQSKFIYLERDLKSWLPSIKSLLKNMITGLTTTHGGFHPTVRQCYEKVFQRINDVNIHSDEHLSNCYNNHKKAANNYFKDRPDCFISINIGQTGAYRQMITFLDIESTKETFPKLNADGQIVTWQQLQHENKIPRNL